MPNEFGIADDIYIAGFDEHGSDHDDTLQKDTMDMQTVKSKIEL